MDLSRELTHLALSLITTVAPDVVVAPNLGHYYCGGGMVELRNASKRSTIFTLCAHEEI
jgi:hypothetical protein